LILNPAVAARLKSKETNGMVIGVLEMMLYLPESHSLKEKRRVVKSVKDKVRSRYNVSIAEIDAQDLWQRACLGVCSLGNDRRYLNAQLEEVIRFVERLQVAVDIDTRIELLDY
jgi:hypothetical protein